MKKQIKAIISGALLLLSLPQLSAQKPVLVLPVGHTDAITCLNYSNDGRYLVSGSKDQTVKLWNQDGRLLRTLSGHDSPLLDVLISPDQQYVLARTDSSYYLWQFTGDLEWRRPAILPPSGPMVADYDQAVFSADGTYLLYTGRDSKANLYNLRSKTDLQLPCNRPSSLSFSPDQQLIMTTEQEALALYNRKGELQKRIPVRNEATALFPAFEAKFIANDRILLGFTYATQQIAQPAYDFSNGGFSQIVDLQGRLQQTFGNKLIIQTDADGKHFQVSKPSGERQEVQLYSSAWSTGGPMHSTDRMDWNDLMITTDGSKMVLSNRYFMAVRTLPSGQPLMIKSKSVKEADQDNLLSNTDPAGDGEQFYPLQLSPDGNHLATKSGETLIIYKLDGSSVTTKKIDLSTNSEGSVPFGGWPAPFAFAPDNKRVLIGDELGNIWISDIDAAPLRPYGPPAINQVIAVHPDTDKAGMADFYFSEKPIEVSQQRWNYEEGSVLKQLFDLAGGRPVDQEEIERDQVPLKLENIHRTKQYTFTSSYDFGLEDFYNGMYFNPGSGIIDVNAQDNTQPEFGFRPSASMFDLGLVQGRYLLTSDFSTKPVLWDFEKLLAERSKMEKVQLYGDNYVDLIPEASFSQARLRQFEQLPVRTKYLDLGVKQPLALIKKRNEWQMINKNGFDRYVETQYLDFQVLNVENSKVTAFAGHPLKLLGAAFLPGERQVISWAEDRSCRIWDTETGRELLKIFWITEKDWIVLNPEGLFDAAPGVMNSLYYVVGKDEIIELEQLKTRYYEPGLLQKVLGYSDEQIRPVEGFDRIELYPEVEARIVENTLQVDLKARNGGIGKLSIFINGKEVAEEANPLPTGDNTERNSSIQLDLLPHRQYLFHQPGSINTIGLRAYNAAGWLKSPSIELDYRSPGVQARGTGSVSAGSEWRGEFDPKLYIISIGTSNYTGQKLDLQYADRDATMMARALQAVGTALFTNGDSLEVHCLSTAPADNTGLEGTPVNWQFADKVNIESVFKQVAQKAKAEDVVAVYFSGHGLSYGSAEQAQFYYLTQGIASDDLSDAAVRKAYTISSEELTGLLNDIPALKQVLIIDACNSGRIVENLTGGTKALNSSQIRALDRMKDRTGMFVLSGSASDKVSYEASEYGQGLLTYALLQGMLGVATRKDTKGQELIDVMKLFQYARDQVPELAKTINGIQTPMLGFPDQAASFDLGILDEAARKNLPIGSRKPVVIRSNFMNQNSLRDDLNLEQLLEVAFREETEEGKDADLIYIDVNDYPDAYSLGGLYNSPGTGQDISITVRLFRNNQKVTDLEIRPTDDPERLVRYIVREVKRALDDQK